VGDRVQLVSIAISVALLAIVLELVRRRKLTEEYGLLWILSSLALLALSVKREILHLLARWLGVFYPPALLLLALIAIVFVSSLVFSVIASRQRQQIERLTEELALLSAEIDDIRLQRGAPAARQIVPRAADDSTESYRSAAAR